MSISGISSMYNANSYTNMKELQKKFMKLATGQKINQAADDAAGCGIAQKMQSQSNGYTMQSRNDSDYINYYNVADGALSSINDSISRLQEIGVRARNGIYSDEDRALMQKEVDQVKESIKDQVNQTEYNGIKVLNNNTNSGLTSVNTSLDALGLSDFDVTGDFNLDSVKNAQSQVSKLRADLGAQTNGLEHKINSEDIANHNIIASMSNITDTDYGLASTNYATQNAINKYSYMAMQAGMSQYSLLATV